jgi:hypothetical protein
VRRRNQCGPACFDVEMKLRRRNANYVDTHYGGSLYSMTDPFYMGMLIESVGPDYIVWDKGASIGWLPPRSNGPPIAEVCCGAVATGDLGSVTPATTTQRPTRQPFRGADSFARTCKPFQNRRPRPAADGYRRAQPTPILRGRLKPVSSVNWLRTRRSQVRVLQGAPSAFAAVPARISSSRRYGAMARECLCLAVAP